MEAMHTAHPFATLVPPQPSLVDNPLASGSVMCQRNQQLHFLWLAATGLTMPWHSPRSASTTVPGPREVSNLALGKPRPLALAAWNGAQAILF